MQEDADTEKLVPEGIKGRVPYKGLVINVINQLIGGLDNLWVILAARLSMRFIKIVNLLKSQMPA